MPELTVAMPAFRAAPFIEQALQSVLDGQDVDLELIVVDDGSDDGTAAVVRRCTDGRVRLLQNSTRRGIGYCHNLIIGASRAPIIAHVDADDFVLPGALRAMTDAVRGSDSIGQAFCDFFPVDSGGEATDAMRAQWLAHLTEFRAGIRDLRQALVVHGMVVNHLRTYPRTVFEVVGGFAEDLDYGVDLEMALRIADRFEIVRVPRPLYAWRRHAGATTYALRWPAFRFWWMRYRMCRRLQRAQGGRLLGMGPLRLHGLGLLGLAYVMRDLPAAARRRPGQPRWARPA